MNNEQLEENLFLLVHMYLDDQNFEGVRDFSLEKDTGAIRIEVWNCVGVDKPDIETFRGRSMADINRKRNKNKMGRVIGRTILPLLTTAERDDLPNPRVGMMMLNTTDNRVQCYMASGWQSL
jgi:hypothetical protein